MPTFRTQALGVRLGLPAAIVTAIVTSVLVGLQLQEGNERAAESLNTYADLLGGVVVGGLRGAMLADERPRIQDQLARLATSRVVRRIDVVDSGGAVVFSSDGRAVGERVSRDSATCAVCHGTKATPTTTGRSIPQETTSGRSVFRFVQPIMAEAECLRCHKNSALGRHLGVLVTAFDDSLLTARQLQGARTLSWTLAVAFAALLASLVVIVRFVVIARLRTVRRLLEFVRAGARASARDPRSFDEIDEIERLIHTVAEELDDRRALDRVSESLDGVLQSYREPVLLVDAEARVLAANAAFLSRHGAAGAVTPGQPLASDGPDAGPLLDGARKNGWALGDDPDAPLVVALEDAAGRVLAFLQIGRAADGEPASGTAPLRLPPADPDWQLYTAIIASGLPREPKRFRGVAQIDPRLTSGRRLMADLASMAAQRAADRTEVDLRSLILLVLWDMRRRFPQVTWYSLLAESHRVLGTRPQLRHLARRLAEAAAAQTGPAGHVVMFTQLSPDKAKVFIGAWARSDDDPVSLEGSRRLPLCEMLARHHGGNVEITRGFDVGPLCAVRNHTIPCDTHGVLFVAELAVSRP